MPHPPRAVAALVIALALILPACTSAPVSFRDRPTGELNLPLKGSYIATVRAPFFGPVRARLSAEPAEQGFIANSRPGVAWGMIGGVEGLLGRIIMPHLFPGGVIWTWSSEPPADGEPGEGRLGIGGVRAMSARSLMTDPNLPIDLLTPDGRRAAALTLESSDDSEEPLADYPALAAAIEKATAERLYDRELAASSATRGYLSQLRSAARVARDDVEFLFGAAVSARSNIKYSIPIPIPRPDAKAIAMQSDGKELATVQATLDRRSNIATLRAEAFLEPEAVDRAFEKILEWNPRGLVIDLRSCPGVRLSSLRVACWLLDRPADAGFFFGPAHREGALAGKLDGFPRSEINSAAAVEECEQLLEVKGAAAAIIVPEKNVYSGPVAVLTSRRTSTSAEPLVWVLRQGGRARVFGGRTAGRPTLSRPVDIGQGWDFWLAAFDYSPPVGERIPAAGLEPDSPNSSRDATSRVARRWIMQQPTER